MEWWQRKKSGIKLTVYSLQNAVCCSPGNISRRSLPRRGRGEGSFSRGVCNNGTLYPAPTAQPTSIHHHSYWKKNLGAPMAQSTLEGPSKNSKYRVRIKYFLMLPWILRSPCSRSPSCTFDGNNFQVRYYVLFYFQLEPHYALCKLLGAKMKKI